MYVVAAALLGLIALLATLQYQWLGQISTAERERMKTNLATRTTAFAQDFDREITRAYLTFQLDPVHEGENLTARLGDRYDGWQGTSRYPRLIKDIFVVTRNVEGVATIQRFNTTSRFIEPAEWPAGFEEIRAHFTKVDSPAAAPGIFMRSIPALWDSVPALVVPAPVVFLNAVELRARGDRTIDFSTGSVSRYAVIAIDRDYIVNEMLPALAQQHFRGAGEGIDYQMAVVRSSDQATVYATTAALKGNNGISPDASTDLFQVRPQEFGDVASQVRRLSTFVTQVRRSSVAATGAKPTTDVRNRVVPRASSRFVVKESAPVSIMLEHGAALPSTEARRSIEAGLAAAATTRTSFNTPRWRLVVKHPAGSLETAVANARRRNLLVSSGILAVLGVSIGFLVVSTRRAQELARQQMEFVAAVSHELRTPLAVIRSAADNLAEGVVREDAQVRKYGELVRGEGRRLTEMVEQILELAGIHSGQRGFALRPVSVAPLLHDVARASEKLVDDAGLEVEFDIADRLPPVLGDEQALRRVFQNLFGNAVKYGAGGGWIGIRARASAREVQVTVSDRGIGIAPADQAHIFEPFYRAPGVIEAQIQGAGLGLSLVQRIVEVHGGRISVRSAPGAGSEFTVHLPSASEAAAARTSTAADAAHGLS